MQRAREHERQLFIRESVGSNSGVEPDRKSVV
jgi:hypothetical protein